MQSRFSNLHCAALKGMDLVPSALYGISESQQNLFIETYKNDLPSPTTTEAELACWREKWQQQPPLACLPSTIPETQQSAFSGLNRLKTYLRCSMGGDRLGGLSLMLVHCDTPIIVDTIIDTFAAKYQTHIAMVNPTGRLRPIISCNK